jgi:hypothetical protein
MITTALHRGLTLHGFVLVGLPRKETKEVLAIKTYK